MIYELRHYAPTAGIKDRMRERFARDSLPLFKKRGIALIDSYRLLGSHRKAAKSGMWSSGRMRRAAKTGWEQFVRTPEWKEIAARTENDGQLSTSRAIVLQRPISSKHVG
ncbi:MAG: hypothetical protein EOR85_33330 [Mesorhizobium sp.]|uniref:hypothetical protein n=1 Tax=Mesorhizobium sp. TaxID=1871066 RepID=UPI000FE6D7F5|nr:hypothetical protein [Mesorhizobium sp.]RWM46124.1 MAG: hypothetical protein EOR79_35095 [Mesorhizobium sp.]RWM89164.1 MAG: hypothetical protein EOR85_33330 [Mesorhizobium sp.]